MNIYRQQRIDLILLDINMPRLDGFGVMEQLKSLQDPLFPPVVILTAQHGQDFLLRALNAGARDFITKPFDRNELLARVRNMLEAQLAHRLVYEQKDVLDEIVRTRTNELRRTRLQVIQQLGRAAEYRDNETGNHILRMSHISALLAEAIGWSKADCELMLHASPMHDIGKIGISYHILLKPGKFEPEEWAIMKNHARIGADILEGDDSDLMKCAGEIALTHHEKWDGGGYARAAFSSGAGARGIVACYALRAKQIELPGQHKDGTVFPMELAITVMEIDETKHFAGIMRDISERKQHEQEIIAAKDEAERASNAKSEFLSSMPHELGTPMNAILGFGQLLEIDAELSEEQADYVNEIIKDFVKNNFRLWFPCSVSLSLS